MGWENREGWKKNLSTAGSALIVYLIFRYALPLILPFILAFLVAVLIRPPVRWLRKYLHLKESIGAVLVLTAAGGLILLLVYYGGGLLFREMQGLWSDFRQFLATLQNQNLLRQFVPYESILETSVHACINYCMSHSPAAVRWCTGFFTAVFVFFIASVLAAEEMERLHQRLTLCIFYKELVDFGVFLSKVCGKWLRVQIMIMLITMFISGTGLWITGFSYALLLGILIGLVDVLPILGTGTIYLPWLIWEFLNRHPGRGFSLLIIYLICYLVRELMENVLMGKCMGITAFEFLAAVYVGLKLFGTAGFILGPLWILTVMWIAGGGRDPEADSLISS